MSITKTEMRASPVDSAINMRAAFDIPYGERPYEKLDCYFPDSEPYDTVIWFHGGGLEGGSRKSIRFAADAVQAGLCVVSVEYRLYPQATFPDYLDDAAEAVAFCLQNRERLGIRGRIFVSGQSAGAYITAMLCLNQTYLARAGADRSQIAGYISDSTQATVHYNILRERGLDTRLERIDEAAPLYWSSAACDYPAFLLICYEHDMPCRATQNRLLYESLTRMNPEAVTRFVCLPGTHVHGSEQRNENGTFDYLKALLAFIHSI